ncbi:MAG: hypothetical protein J5889_01605 [Clostridia bacterium]|nr:hypothetical protein [Clostridia bacterium]
MKRLLAIIMTLIMLCGIPALAEDVPPIAAKDFEGEWQCGRASIEMYWEEEGFRVHIRWGSSAWERTEWEYSCYYHEDTGEAVSMPFGTRTEYVYGENGELASVTEVYNDGEATFALTEDGFLTWKDEKENAGEGMLFEKQPAQDPAPLFETIGQAIEEGEYDGRFGTTEEYHIIVIEKDGEYIRVIGLKDEKANQLDEEIFTADDWEAARGEYEAYANTLPVVRTEVLTQPILSEEELDAFVGKTLGDLEAEGFESVGSGQNGEEVEFIFNYGLYTYRFVVNESPEQYEAALENDGSYAFTVRSASLYELSSNVYNLDYEADGTRIQNSLLDSFDFMQVFYDAFTSGEIDLDSITEAMKDMPPEAAEQFQAFLDTVSDMAGGMTGLPGAAAE